ncbi:hypothetical protein ACFWGC_23695, partial [Cytobacillus pseudoceanisediminis]|uniref:hypothetical protein n=1 Tax=Cytobacillus pseudoceanisediminis TaxID=3051614 RepID=UPI00364F96E7
FKSPQALYYFYFKIKKTADKHDFHRVCRQSEAVSKAGRCFTGLIVISMGTFFTAAKMQVFE